MSEAWRSTHGRPKVFAHRGGAAGAPENTLAAFDRALELNVDGIELDVRMTSDRVPVVFHDATLDRTTNARGPLSKFTLKDLESVDAGYRFPGRKNQRIPTLESVLDRYRSTPMILEIKEKSVLLSREVLHLIEQAEAFDRVMISGIHHSPALFARQYWHPVATGASEREAWRAWIESHFSRTWMNMPFEAFQIPMHWGRFQTATPRFVEWVHKQGKAFHVWTVNSQEEMETYFSMGVDVVITDRPDAALAMLGKAAAA